MSDSIKALQDLLRVAQDPSSSDPKTLAEKISPLAKAAGVTGTFHQAGLVTAIKAMLDNKKQPRLRESALLILASVAKAVGQAGEPYLIPLVPKVLDGYADKDPAVRSAADEASKAIMALPSRYAVKLLLPVLFDSIENGRWQSQCGSLQILTGLSKTSPKQISNCLSEIVPVLSASMWSTRPE
ncbi:translational elongation factor EF-1 alpha, partial [Lunasporangiospora selenospora]